MRLTGTDDTDIALDQYGQPVVGEDGDVRLVSEEDCWIQDVWMEMLTEEGELLHEDEEGRWAYGFGYGTVLNGLDSEEANEEIYARTREKTDKTGLYRTGQHKDQHHRARPQRTADSTGDIQPTGY